MAYKLAIAQILGGRSEEGALVLETMEWTDCNLQGTSFITYFNLFICYDTEVSLRGSKNE